MNTYTCLCDNCELVANCQTYLEILKKDNDRQLSQFHPQIHTLTVIYSCEYYKKFEPYKGY